MRNIKRVEEVLKQYGLKYVLQSGGDVGLYFVCINCDGEDLPHGFETEISKIAKIEKWDYSWCPDPESHIFQDKDINEAWEDKITVLNLL